MDEQAVKLLAKTMAHEIVLTATTVRLYKFMQAAGVKFDLMQDLAVLEEEYGRLAIPGINAALSDVLASELAEEVSYLVKDIAKRVASRP